MSHAIARLAPSGNAMVAKDAERIRVARKRANANAEKRAYEDDDAVRELSRKKAEAFRPKVPSFIAARLEARIRARMVALGEYGKLNLRHGLISAGKEG